MGIGRRRFLVGTAKVVTLGTALGSPGIYELVDLVSGNRAREALAAPSLPAEQHLMQQLPVINVNPGGVQATGSDTVPVLVPPLHFQVNTAKLNVPATAVALLQAQQFLEATLQNLEATYPSTPSGLGITVAWGLPYFGTYVAQLNQASSYFAAGTAYPDYLPVDNPASRAAGSTVRAILDAFQFPSDQPPPTFPGYPKVLLEDNDVAVLFRSDSLNNITAGANAIFGTGAGQAGSLFTVTSIRKGFMGGGFTGKESLPKQMALAGNIPGAKDIPDNAEMFMGFASTQNQSLGPGVIANLEAIPGLTDQWPGGYFVRGATMHLSHLYLDLLAWYEKNNNLSFSKFSDRLRAAFRPGLKSQTETQVVPEGPPQSKTLTAVEQDLSTYGSIGHSESLQPATRLQADLTDNYGNVYPMGTPIPQRSDFDSLDNPFFYSSNPSRDGYANSPAASLHFVVFTPTSDAFHRGRRGMDGRYVGRTLNLDPRSFNAGFNAVLHTTHRQNFLVPPRVHRSLPLAEYL